MPFGCATPPEWTQPDKNKHGKIKAKRNFLDNLIRVIENSKKHNILLNKKEKTLVKKI